MSGADGAGSLVVPTLVITEVVHLLATRLGTVPGIRIAGFDVSNSPRIADVTSASMSAGAWT